MNVILNTAFFEGEHFPFNESNCYEFKRSIHSNNFERYVEIICGFLNSGGGHLIFGIEDSLKLVGIHIGNDLIDQFIRRFDQIICQHFIIGINQNQMVCQLTTQNIQVQLVQNTQGKRFIAVVIHPSNSNDISYQIRLSGKIFYRLGASTYVQRHIKFLSVQEHESILNDEIRKNASMFQINLNELEYKNRQLLAQMNQLQMIHDDKLKRVHEEKEKQKSEIQIHQQYVHNCLSKYNELCNETITQSYIPCFDFLREWF